MDASSGAEDAVLVERLSAGDRKALAELYDRFGADLYSLACSIVKEPADAEEVVGDVFMKLWENPGRYSADRGSVRTFLSVATRSRAIDAVRSRRRRGSAMERAASADHDGFASPVSGVGENPRRSAERSELREALRASMDLLPDPQRTALELAYFGGFTQREIADELAEPLGTVKTRIRDGMRKLRATMASFRAEAGR